MTRTPHVIAHSTAAAVLVLSGATAALSTGPAWAAPRPASATRAGVALPGLTNCGSGTPVVRRRSFVIFCGDAGEIGEDLHWVALTPRRGVAKGRAAANDCVPTCAAGHVHSYRARFVFSRVRDIHGPAFTEVAITYTGRRTPYGQRHQHNRIA